MPVMMICTDDPHDAAIARLLLYNTRQLVDVNGSLHYAKCGLLTEAFTPSRMPALPTLAQIGAKEKIKAGLSAGIGVLAAGDCFDCVNCCCIS
jgi:hypothetical protein